MSSWYVKHGQYWCIQWCRDWWLSFGIHIDFKKRKTGKQKIRYGPYFDIHVFCFIISIGINPYYSLDGADGGNNDKNIHI